METWKVYIQTFKFKQILTVLQEHSPNSLELSYSIFYLPGESKNVSFSIERKMKTTSMIFKILTFLNKDFSILNFDTLLFSFCFILADLFYF